MFYTGIPEKPGRESNWTAPILLSLRFVTVFPGIHAWEAGSHDVIVPGIPGTFQGIVYPCYFRILYRLANVYILKNISHTQFFQILSGSGQGVISRG